MRLQQRRNYSSHTDAELARAFRVLAHPLRISALRAFAISDEPLAAGDVAYMEREDGSVGLPAVLSAYGAPASLPAPA